MGMGLLILAGVLLGGTWSLYQQEAGTPMIVVCGALAVLATVAGVMWL